MHQVIFLYLSLCNPLCVLCVLCGSSKLCLQIPGVINMRLSDPQTQTYEQLPYESNPFFESHPGRLATIAYLAGLEPPSPATCRVLELGCAGGGNLIPAAESLPGATFIGVDLAPNQISDGNQIIAALGLKNIRLHAMSLTEITADFGQFDFIIAHGIYSWVPPDVQRRILQICKAHLSPNGIAYISYNTQPGWRLRGITRDLLLYGQAGIPSNTSLRTKLARSRDFAEMILEAAGDEDTGYRRVLSNEIDLVLKAPDSYIAHEHLEPWHEPIYFREFAARMAEQGLNYLGDARSGRAVQRVESRLRAQQPELELEAIHFEQCVDFAVGRQFRRSLMVHAGQMFQRQIDPVRLMKCHLTAGVFPTSQIDLHQDGEVCFQSHDGGTFSTGDAALRAAIVTIARAFPAAIAFDAVMENVRIALNLRAEDSGTKLQLAQSLVSMFNADFLEPHLTPPVFIKEISRKPTATSLARWQAANSRVIHNRRHRGVRSLDSFECSVLAMLDGTRDIAALQKITGATDHAIRACLQKLAMSAVLTG